MSTKDKIWYALLVPMAFFAIGLEFVPTIDGIFETNTPVEFYTEYAAVFVTLVAVYITLRLYKGNNIIRMVVLSDVFIGNILLYHMFMDTSFLYLALIALAGYPFVKGGKDNNPTNKENES